MYGPITRSFRQVTGLPRCLHRLSDRYLEYASESPYSVQNMANIRIRLIFDSSNTLVNRLGPSRDRKCTTVLHGGVCHRTSTPHNMQIESIIFIVVISADTAERTLLRFSAIFVISK